MIPEGFCDVTALAKGGVYLLLWKGEVVYVGQSTKLHGRVSTHFYGKGKRQQRLNGRIVRGVVFDQVLVMACALPDLDLVERELIERYIPRYNERHKPKLVIPLEDLIGVQLVPMLPPAPEPRQNSTWRRW